MNQIPEDNVEQKIGLLGGTFDPVHLGHLLIAQAVCEILSLDRVIFIPASRNPLKLTQSVASNEQRAHMIRLAIDQDPRFDISTCELERTSGSSYTFDTVKEMKLQFPQARLVWILGSDQMETLHQWYKIHELAELVEFASVERPGFHQGVQKPVPGIKIHPISYHPFSVSATEIRERIKKGLPVSLFLPPKIDEYLKTNNPYLS